MIKSWRAEFVGFSGDMCGVIFAFHTTMRSYSMTILHFRIMASGTTLRYFAYRLSVFMFPTNTHVAAVSSSSMTDDNEVETSNCLGHPIMLYI